MLEDINLLAVLACAIGALLLGALWYSPLLFLRPWMQATGLTEAELAAGSPMRIYGGAFVLALVSAFVFAAFLGPTPAFGFALGAGVSAGACWVGASFGMSYLFEQKPRKLFWINGGYYTLQFALFGALLGGWH